MFNFMVPAVKSEMQSFKVNFMDVVTFFHSRDEFILKSVPPYMINVFT